VNKVATKETSTSIDEGSGGIVVGGDGNFNVTGRLLPISCMGAPPVVAGLRPKQVRAAMLLTEGWMAKEVARVMKVAPETVSRWRSQPAFQLLIRALLHDVIEAARLGLVSLCSESIAHLRGLMSAIDEKTQLKAISLLFSKAGPLLAAISAEVQRPLTRNAEIVSRESHRITEPSAYLNGSVAENSTVRS